MTEMFDDTFQPAADWATTTPLMTALLYRGGETAWVYAFGEPRMIVLRFPPVRLFIGEMPGVIRELHVAQRQSLTDKFNTAVHELRQEGFRQHSTAPAMDRVWSADPWDVPSVLDTAAAF